MSHWAMSLGGGRRGVGNVVVNVVVGAVQDQELVETATAVVGILVVTTRWITIRKMVVIGIAAI